MVYSLGSFRLPFDKSATMTALIASFFNTLRAHRLGIFFRIDRVRRFDRLKQQWPKYNVPQL